MKRAVAIAIVVVAVGAAAWLAWYRGWLFRSRADQRGDGGEGSQGTAGADARWPSPAQGEVAALGRIEPVDRVIDVGALVGDRLAVLKVSEGVTVEEGVPLAELASREIRRLELKSVESQLAEAKARRAAEKELAAARITTAQVALEKAQSQQPEIEAQRQRLALAQANLEQMQLEAARLTSLSKDLVSDQERERQLLAVQQVEGERQAAQVLLDKLVLARDLGLRSAAADLKAAKASRDQVLSTIPVKSLQASRDVAKKQLERTVITAPCKGTILKIFTRPGELIGNTPILQMADLTRMAVIAEVHESAVRRIRPDQTARIRSKAFQTPDGQQQVLQGQVTRVGAMVSSPGLRHVDPFKAAERHVVEVRIELDEESSRRSANYTNLQVDVTFLLD